MNRWLNDLVCLIVGHAWRQTINPKCRACTRCLRLQRRYFGGIWW